MLELFVVPNIWLKKFKDVHLTYVVIECNIVLSYLYSFPGFSGNLLPVLVCDFELGNICFRVVVNGAVLEYCTSS